MSTGEILSQHVYQYLLDHIPSDHPGNYLEIGVFNGAGTARLAEAWPDRHVYAVDPFIEDGNTTGASGQTSGQTMVAQREAYYANAADRTNQSIYEMTSSAFLDQLTSDQINQMNVRIVMIDGDHHYPAVTNDWHLALRLLDGQSGVVIFDDLAVPDVAQAVQEFQTVCADRITEVIHIAGGVALAAHVAAI